MAKRRLSIALATCKKTYETAKDDIALHKALQSLNISIKFPVWSQEEENGEEYDPVVPFDNIDLLKHFSQFCKWLHVVSQNQSRLQSHFYTCLERSQKYLEDLQTSGIQLMPTAYITKEQRYQRIFIADYRASEETESWLSPQ